MLPRDQAWRLVIAGAGGQRADLEAQAHALGLSERVVFTGFVERPGSVLGGLDVYVLTSDTEQMPISVLEAMAVGLPVLATDVGTCASCCLPRAGTRAYSRGTRRRPLPTVSRRSSHPPTSAAGWGR